MKDIGYCSRRNLVTVCEGTEGPRLSSEEREVIDRRQADIEVREKLFRGKLNEASHQNFSEKKFQKMTIISAAELPVTTAISAVSSNSTPASSNILDCKNLQQSLSYANQITLHWISGHCGET
ncbi:hypothetical protein TNCV_4728231 [Trichonephila clavipes]|nr:hypothetical protein TNCV_4728231 [Trichonephila clavipes]